jgi:RHS repeat-associated protein
MGSLIAVNLPDGRLIEYITDGKRRRIGKMVNGVLTKQWLYRDQLKPVAELDGAGNLIAEFIFGTKANVPDLVIRGGVTYRLVSDQLGSAVMAINTANSADVPFQATYAAFGERTLVAGIGDWTPFGFAGGHFDSDTKLTRFGARDYDSITGRWSKKDPIGFSGRESNLYNYVHGSPLDRTDIWGLIVEVCSGDAENSILNVLAAIGIQHEWLRTGSKEVGLGGTVLDTQAEDHSGFGNLPGSTCEQKPMVDEDCVNNELQVGQSFGVWIPGSCWIYVSAILAKCTTHYGSSPSAGSEGSGSY